MLNADAECWKAKIAVPFSTWHSTLRMPLLLVHCADMVGEGNEASCMNLTFRHFSVF